MKANIYVEFQGKKINVKQIEGAFRELWKEKGGKIKDLGDVDLYYKPDENVCYYVVAETEETGKMDM